MTIVPDDDGERGSKITSFMDEAIVIIRFSGLKNKPGEGVNYKIASMDYPQGI